VAELTTAQDAEVAGLRLQLATVQSELREARPLVEQKTIDVSTMHSYSARHADCLRSLSRALQSVAEGLRGLSRMQSREGQPAKVREACDLECQVENLSEALTAVEKSHSISMVRCTAQSLPPVPKVRLPTHGGLSRRVVAAAGGALSGSGGPSSESEEVVRLSEEEDLLRETPSPTTPHTHLPHHPKKRVPDSG
jgi:hypothetical protein